MEWVSENRSISTTCEYIHELKINHYLVKNNYSQLSHKRPPLVPEKVVANMGGGHLRENQQISPRVKWVNEYII